MIESPFSGAPVAEVHLPKAPLAHVVAQVRFPKILNLDDQSKLAQVHASIKDAYPVLRPERAIGLVIATTEGTPVAPTAGVVWRFQTKESDWQVTLADTFVALDTSSYVSRSDFVSRLGRVLQSVRDVFDPVIAERVGIRYVDRIEEDGDFSHLVNLIRREAIGGIEIPTVEGVTLRHSLSENVFVVEDDQVVARWGVLPAGATLDPVIPPASTRSWILDIDVARGGRLEFEAGGLSLLTSQLAERAYRFFRWAALDQLIEESGGAL